MKTGPDLSQHNGNIDFSKIKAAGHSFVLIREGYGNEVAWPKQKDTFYESNYKKAKSVGLNVGVYHYLYATSVEAAKTEAQGFLNNLKGKSFDMPIALDIEERSQYNLPNATVEAIIKAFMDICEKAGYYCLLYSYEAFLTAKMSASFRAKYDVWCANISKTPGIKYGIHQYTFTGTIPGVSGRVDLNKTEKDYPSIIVDGGFNGYVVPEKILDTTGLKKGDKNLAVLAYKQLLMIAKKTKVIASGVDNNNVYGDGTEKATNELLKKLGYKQNGIAGENLIKKLNTLVLG